RKRKCKSHYPERAVGFRPGRTSAPAGQAASDARLLALAALAPEVFCPTSCPERARLLKYGREESTFARSAVADPRRCEPGGSDGNGRKAGEAAGAAGAPGGARAVAALPGSSPGGSRAHLE